MRLLIVEDELRVRTFLTRGLAEEGFNISECADGPSALRMMAEERFDLVLLNWMILGLPGIDVLTTARERGSDIIDLQDFAGHADPTTTLTYIRNRDRLSKSPAYVLRY